MDEQVKKKLGDVLCDIGKYMLTAVPFGYFFSEKQDASIIILVVSLLGGFLIVLGLILVRKGNTQEVQTSHSKKKVKLLKNTTYVIEEQQIQ